jgi:hypothetical protein
MHLFSYSKQELNLNLQEPCHHQYFKFDIDSNVREKSVTIALII